MTARVVISGGGTGGHVMPALAIGRALVELGLEPDDVHFVGAARGIETTLVPEAGFPLTALPGRGIERKLTLRNVANAWGIVRAVVSGVRLIRRLRPGVVVVLGGYASVPAAVGAALWRVPMVVSEQNAVPSLANRLAARLARAAAVPCPQGLPREVVTGNPVRAEVVAARSTDRADARRRLGLPTDRTTVAVVGGSLGALRINTAVREWVHRHADRHDLAVHHVVGRRDWPDFADPPDLPADGLRYRAVEFEHDIPTVLAASDLVVGRAGASTVAELAVVGRPAVLVPGPFAPNDAQGANAAMLVDAGAAVLVRDHDFDADRLTAEIDALLAGDRLARMADAARAVGRPDAAEAVADLALSHARPVD